MNGREFSLKEANVACRQLGFYSASHWNNSVNTEYVFSYSIHTDITVYIIEV